MLERRRCGTTGLELSVLGLGCWAFGGGAYWGEEHDQDAVDREVRLAYDLGVNYFDTAEAYNDGRSEESLGRALKGLPRDKVIVGSKFLPHNGKPATLVKHCEASLTRLGMERIDLYMIHWPINRVSLTAFGGDRDILDDPPLTGEVFDTLSRLREQGKIGHVGVSNYGVSKLREALGTGAVIAANQVVYSMLYRAAEHELMPFCRRQGIGVVGYMTLLQGILADIWRDIDDIPPKQRRFRLFDSAKCDMARHGEKGAEEKTVAALDEIRAVARETGLSMADLAIKWTVANPGLTCALVGTRNPDNLQANVGAASDPLPDDIVQRLSRATDTLKEQLGPGLDIFENPVNDRTGDPEGRQFGPGGAVV